jgi:hypothetical protein
MKDDKPKKGGSKAARVIFIYLIIHVIHEKSAPMA